MRAPAASIHWTDAVDALATGTLSRRTGGTNGAAVNRRTRVARLAGVAFALFPAGLAAVMLVRSLVRSSRRPGPSQAGPNQSGRDRSNRRRSGWGRIAPFLVAASLIALASAFAGTVDLLLLAQVLILGGVVVTASRGPQATVEDEAAAHVGVGLGLSLAAVLSVVQVVVAGSPLLTGLVPDTGPLAVLLGPSADTGRAHGWAVHPNAFAASMLVPSVYVAARSRRLTVRAMVVVPALVVIAASGSRTALVALLAGLAVAIVPGLITGDARRRRVSALSLAGAVVVLTALVLAVPGLRTRLVPTLAPVTGTSVNLLVSTADLSDPTWWRPRLTIERHSGEPSSRRSDLSQPVDVAWELTRIGGEWTDRLQQRVTAGAGTPYTLSFEYLPASPDATFGVIAWGTRDGEPHGFVARGKGASWLVDPTGGIDTAAPVVVDAGASWQRVELTFTNTEPADVTLEIGVAPDLAPRAAGEESDTLVVRRLQLNVGREALPFVPTPAPDRTASIARDAVGTRVSIYREAFRLIAQRPLVGWGTGGFEVLRDASTSPAQGAAHEHSLFVWAALRYGVLGIGAVALLFVGLATRRREVGAMLVALLVANLFDLTFFSSGLAYGAALAAGFSRRTREHP